MKTLLLLLTISLFSASLIAQDSTSQDSINWSTHFELRKSSFNQGNYSHGWGLINGRIPGLMISKPGAALENSYQVRLRGQTSFFGNVSPLIVVDGVIGSSMDAIDPADITSFKILNSTESARYGMQGSNGVIEIETHGFGKDQFEITTNYFHAFESKVYKQKPLDAITYRSLSNTINFGEETDWMEEVTQAGHTDALHLKISGNHSPLSYRVSINSRTRSGILKNTDARRFTFGTKLKSSFFDDDLQISYAGQFRNEKMNPGLPEVFKYALISNPTLGISDQNGDYNERDIFDYFNPVAINELAKVGQTLVSQNHFFETKYQLGNSTISGNWGSYQSIDMREEQYPDNLKFRNDSRRTEENKYFTTQYGLTFLHNWSLDDLDLQVDAGYQYQEMDFQNEFYSEFESSFINEDESRHKITLAAYYVGTNLLWKDFFFSGILKNEGSSALAEDEKYQLFYQANGGVDISRNLDSFNSLKLSAGYAKSGLTPYLSGLSKLTYLRDSDPPFAMHNANPKLKNEETRTISLSINGRTSDDRLSFNASIYRSSSTDLLGQFFVSQQLASSTYDNFGKMINQGIEIYIDYDIIKANKFTWVSSINFSTFNNKMNDLSGALGSFEGVSYGYPGAPGFGSEELFLLDRDLAIGTFFVPEVEEISSDREWIFKDLDGDGVYCNCHDDRSSNVGSGFPGYSFGWFNDFKLGAFSLSFLVRGVGGHELMNMSRLFYQAPTDYNLESFNVLASFRELSNVNSTRVSDYFIEKGGYATMEFLSLQYRTAVGKISTEFFFTANNLFTISSYSGNSPEVRIFDTGTASNGGYRNAQFASLSYGLDQRIEWLPSKSITIGVELLF